MNQDSKVVLITGASSGIGRATALRLAGDGHHVVVAARRVDRLLELVATIEARGGTAQAAELDVTNRAAFQHTVDAVVDRHGHIDVVVNNAGVMLLSNVGYLLVDEWDHMVNVNLRGLMYGVAAALPHFQAQGSGHFVTVASVGAHQVVPTSAVYSATKYAAWAFTEGLRQDLDPTLRVTTISPGVVESELADSITEPHARDMMRDYRREQISSDTIATSVAFAIDQPTDVDVNEIVIRPVGQR